MIRIVSGLLILFSISFSSSLKAYTDSFADLVENLSPAVVSIASTTIVTNNNSQNQMPQFPEGSPFDEFFKDYFDNERRNVELLKQIEKTIDLGYKIVLWPDDLQEKDINDMIISGKTKDEVQTIINKNSYQGNMAKIRFTTWRRRNA